MNNDPVGWICGKWFIGYLYESQGQQGSSTKELFLLITQKQLKMLSDGNNSDANGEQEEKKMIDFLERDGLF